MTKLAKLDMYDCTVFPGIIRVKLNRSNDPILVDIMSDIFNSDNKIYFDGERYTYNNQYNVIKNGKEVYVNLHVSKK